MEQALVPGLRGLGSGAVYTYIYIHTHIDTDIDTDTDTDEVKEEQKPVVKVCYLSIKCVEIRRQIF